MNNLLLGLPLVILLFTSCEKEAACEWSCTQDYQVLDTCAYEDLDAQMINFNHNLSTSSMTKEIRTPLVWDSNSYSYRAGIVQYLIDGQPITQINYKVGNRQGVRTDFLVYNPSFPCESQTTSCLFEQPMIRDWCGTID